MTTSTASMMLVDGGTPPGERLLDVDPTTAKSSSTTSAVCTRKVVFKRENDSGGEDSSTSTSTTRVKDNELSSKTSSSSLPPEGLSRVLKEFVAVKTSGTAVVAATTMINQHHHTTALHHHHQQQQQQQQQQQTAEDQPQPQNKRDEKDTTTTNTTTNTTTIALSPRGGGTSFPRGAEGGTSPRAGGGGIRRGGGGATPTATFSSTTTMMMMMNKPPMAVRFDDHADGDRMILHNIDSELESFDVEYRRQRQMLEEKVKEHDHNYLARSQMVQGKLAEALEKTKRANDVKLAMAQDAWSKQLSDAVTGTHKRLEEERQDRLDAIADLTATIDAKMQLLDDLQHDRAVQHESMVAVETDRAALKQEVKNILVTLHFQFENLTKKLTTQEDELMELERAQRNSVAEVESSVQEVTTYVDAVQHEVSQVQLETKALWKQCEDEQNAAREVLGQTLTELVAQTKAELSSRFSDYSEQFQTMEGMIGDRTTALEADLLQRVSALAEELSTNEEQARLARAKIGKDCTVRIQETEDTIFQSIDVHMAHMENQQREMQEQVNEQSRKSDEVSALVTKIAEDFIEVDARKHREMDEVFAKVNRTLSDHTTVATQLGLQIATTAEHTSDRFEQVCHRLESLEKSLTAERTERIADKRTFETLTREQLECIKTLQEKLSEANEYSEGLFDRMLKVQKSHAELLVRHETLQKKHEALEGSHYVVERNFETHLSETRQSDNNVHAYMAQTDETIDTIENAVSQLSRDLKARSESLGLEFRTELANVSDRFASVDRRHGDVLKQLSHQEIALSSINVPELVEDSVKPILQANTALAVQLEDTTEELRQVRDDVQAGQALREVFDARLVEVKKTSDGLFQHLASSVLSSQTELKNEVQTLKSSLGSIEARMEESLSKQDSSSAGLDSIVNEQSMSLRALFAKVDLLENEIQTSVSRIGSRLTEYKLFREELAKEQFAMKDKVTRSVDNLVQWKREIESTVNDGKAAIARDLLSQQDAADKQVAKMILKVTKEEHQSLQSVFDAKLDRWSKKVEIHSIEVEERINCLCETVALLMKDKSDGQDEASTVELRDLVDSFSKQNSKTSNKDLPGQGQQTRFLMDAINELRVDMINRNSMVLQLDDRVSSWVAETGETLKQLSNCISSVQRQLGGQDGDTEGISDAMEHEERTMMSKAKELTDLEAKLKDMSRKLKDSRYECRGLRVKLLQMNSDDENPKCASF